MGILNIFVIMMNNMKLISLNINTNLFYHLAIPFLKKENPDVICIQEFLETDISKFEKEFKMKAVFVPQVYIYHESQGGLANKRYGLCILAKEIADWGFDFYVGSKEHIDLPFKKYFSKKEYYKDGSFKSDKPILWAEIKFKDKIYKIINIHFTITKDGKATREQLKDLASLFKVLKKHKEFVLCGDMNAPRGKDTFKRLALKYKDNVPKKYKYSLDQNLHRVKNLPHMVDGLFTTTKYKASSVSLVDGVSDHLAIKSTIGKTK